MVAILPVDARGNPLWLAMDKDDIPRIQKWLEDLSCGRIDEYASVCLRGLQVVRMQRGFILCNFVIPNCLADRNGYWHAGAIATLIDVVGSAVIMTATWAVFKMSVDFNLSYHSTVKIEEEVEIEAKVVGRRGKLSLNIVEIRKKENREMVALGKQWMANLQAEPSHPSKL